MGKRKHGTASTPMGFSTRNYEMLRAKKVAGENISDYIDKAIEHYDGTINWKARGKDEDEVRHLEFLRDIASIKKHLGEMNLTWVGWLRAQTRIYESGEEE